MIATMEIPQSAEPAQVAALLAQIRALQAELEQTRQERDRARRALRVRELEETGLYDCYGQSIK